MEHNLQETQSASAVLSTSVRPSDRLDLSVPSVRLLQILPPSNERLIKCSTRHVLIDSPPKYTALSYVCAFLEPGVTAQQGRVVELDGRTHLVSDNLWNFLNEAQHQFALADFWIDALCINQLDVKERNHQVAQMHRIFGSAAVVLIWLGRGDDDTRSFARAVNERRWGLQDNLDDKLLDIRTADGNLDRSATQGALKVFKSTYWHRYWIVQEVVLAKEIRVMTGAHCFAWADMTAPSDLSPDAIEGVHFGRATNIIAARTEKRSRAGGLTADTDELVDLVHLFQGGQSLDKHDSVYALQGIAKESTRVKVLYEELFEYTAFRVAWQAWRSRNPLLAGSILEIMGFSVNEWMQLIESLSVEAAPPGTPLNWKSPEYDRYSLVEFSMVDGSESPHTIVADFETREYPTQLILCPCRQCALHHDKIAPRRGDIAAFIPQTDLLVLMRPCAEEAASYEIVACLETQSSANHPNSFGTPFVFGSRVTKDTCFAPNTDLQSVLSSLRAMRVEDPEDPGPPPLVWQLSLRDTLEIYQHSQLERFPQPRPNYRSLITFNHWSHAGLFLPWDKGTMDGAEARIRSRDNYLDEEEWNAALTKEAKIERAWRKEVKAGRLKDPGFCRGHSAMMERHGMFESTQVFCDEFLCTRLGEDRSRHDRISLWPWYAAEAQDEGTSLP